MHNYYTFISELKLGNIFGYHKTKEIRKLFDGYYSDEIINKIQNFYFNKHNLVNETTKLEAICHVSKLYIDYKLCL